MKKPNAKTIAARLLLGFVLVSIGYAVGREVARRQYEASGPSALSSPGPAVEDRVMVYYLHGSIRCVTCNQIEQAAHQVVTGDFAEAMQAGRLGWEVVNFEDRPDLAKRFDVAASTLVVARMEDGRPAAFEKLDKTWQLTDRPDELRRYIHQAVAAMLNRRPAGTDTEQESTRMTGGDEPAGKKGGQG